MIGRQISQTIQRSFHQLTQATDDDRPSPSLTIDTPIQQVLAALQGTEAAQSNDRPPRSFLQRLLARLLFFAPSPSLSRGVPKAALVVSPALSFSICGIASLIPTGKLVLVAGDNQIVDILTIAQQDQLRERMIWEMATFWRSWRQQQIGATPSLAIVDRPNSLPPVRFFHQLMAWVQTSPVAIAANLFQEATWVRQPIELDWFTPEVGLVAFNPAHLVPRRMPASSDVDKLIRQLPRLGELEALIWAAVRYFFGSPGKKRLETHPPKLHLQAQRGEDLWLTTSDLFGTHKSLPTKQADAALEGRSSAPQIDRRLHPVAHLPAQDLPQGDATLALPFQRPIGFGNSVHRWLDRLSPPRPANLVSRKSSHLTKAAKPGAIAQPLRNTDRNSAAIVGQTQVIQTRGSSIRLSQPERESHLQPYRDPNDPPSRAATHSSWIDTPATPIGYVQSPLERLLGWFDRGMAAIEKTLLAIWNWLTRA